MLRQINLNTPIKDLSGQPIENSNLGGTLAGALVNQPKGNPLKFWAWAVAFNNMSIVILDEADWMTLYRWVSQADNLAIGSKAQIMQILSAAPAYTEEPEQTEGQ